MTTPKSSTTPRNPNPSPAAPAAGPPVITSVSRTKVAAEVSFQTLVTGLPVLFAGEASLVLPSGTYTLEGLTAPLQARIAASEATKAAETAFHDAVAAEQPIVASSDELRKEVKQVAVGRFGAQSTTLAQLGFTPAKPRQVSAATKAGSAVKAKATRSAKKAAAAPVVQATAVVAPATAPAPQGPAAVAKPGS
jgi:hypothetical protein